MSLPGDRPRLPLETLDHVTCLGCGCTCDDISVALMDGRIVDAANACALGRSWFGDGSLPDAIRVGGDVVTLEGAIDAIAEMLRASRAPLIYLAPELSCEAQRAVVAVADYVRGRLDTTTSDTALNSLLAAQEQGRAGATLGEVRNRADVVVFWGVDPDVRYPRYRSRYAPEPEGLHSGGRAARTVIAVDVDGMHGPADADVRIAMSADEEVALITATTALVRKPGASVHDRLNPRAASLATRLSAARYSVVVADAEPYDAGAATPGRDARVASALIALTQALNGPSRSALSTLRGGGNRNGADAVLTAQTGFPTAIDFSRGFPAYRPYDVRTATDAALVVGDARRLPSAVSSAIGRLPLAIVGPRAGEHPTARVTIDTGMAGIHCPGTVLRMDDVPLPLRPAIAGHRDPVEVLQLLRTRLGARSDFREFTAGAPDTPHGVRP